MKHAYDLELDASLDECPVPTIKTKEALDTLASGAVLKVLTTREGAIRNIRTFVSNSNCQLVDELKTEQSHQLFIRKL